MYAIYTRIMHEKVMRFILEKCSLHIFIKESSVTKTLKYQCSNKDSTLFAVVLYVRYYGILHVSTL